MQIIDCFIFYNELDLLHIRLEELYNRVDKFVIIEANYTFAGNKKGWNFEENISRYSKYVDKIIYIKVEDMPNNGNAWDNEYHQRNALTRSYSMFEDDDIIIISDLDEIPRNEIIQKIRDRTIQIPVRLGMKFYNYNFNCFISQTQHNVPAVYYVKDARGITPQKIREQHVHIIPDAGWHLSWFGDAEFCKNKIKNFAHQELNNEYFLSHLDARRAMYQDYYPESGRNWDFNHIFLDSTLPECVLDRRFKFIEKYIDQPIKIAFISYGDDKFKKSRVRIIKEAKATGIFDFMKCYSRDDLGSEFTERNNRLLSQSRGGGYWCWKPYIILKTLETVSENSWVLYADAGCTLIQDRKIQVIERILEMNKHGKEISAYQMPHIEKDWTKKDMFMFFGVEGNDEIINTGQYVGSVFMVKNTPFTRSLFEKCVDIISNNNQLIDDSPSIQSNYAGFREHRHDQSLLSILRKLNKEKVYVIPTDETWHGNDFVQVDRIRC